MSLGMSSRWFPSPHIVLWTRAFVLALVLINAAFLIKAFQAGTWIYTQDHKIVPADFVSFWSTSHMLQKGPAADVYDWTLHHAAEVDVLGQDHTRHLPWLNPPVFLLAVYPLALMPYIAALFSWLGITFLAYAAAIRAILRNMSLWWLIAGACAFPATAWTVVTGQNGLLTGALVGGTLALLDKRPLVAGIFLGLLIYKPQFGILFPIVLLASARWKVFAAATATTLVLIGLTVILFGADTWLAFWNSIPLTQKAILAEGQMGTYKLQSFYGAVLWLTGSTAAAWAVQALATTAVAAGVIWIWRRRISVEIRSAALGLGALLATPYVLIYDFPVLAIPLAFLIRAGRERGFFSVRTASDAGRLRSRLCIPSHQIASRGNWVLPDRSHNQLPSDRRAYA
jgi:arabinofuranan 3-O-arabinosyltransferase